MSEGEDILDGLSQDPAVPDDLVSRAKILGVYTDATFAEQTDLNAEDSSSTNEHPVSEYKSRCSRKRRMDSRYQHAPDGFSDKTVSYIQHDKSPETCSTCSGEGEENCSSCNGSGRVDCSTCGGKEQVKCDNCTQGEVDCSNCNGEGTLTHQESEPCSNCNGSGVKSCFKLYRWERRVSALLR